MDGIQPVPGPFGVPSPRPAALIHPSFGPPTAAAKSAADYLRALRRRAWAALAIALVVALPGSIWILRAPSTYRATSQIRIVPPHFDPFLMGIVPNNVAEGRPGEDELYIPDHIDRLKNAELASKVAADPTVAAAPGSDVDVVAEIRENLRVVPHVGTRTFDVSLDGTDPERVQHLLNALLGQFRQDAREEGSIEIDGSKRFAEDSLAKMTEELDRRDKEIHSLLKTIPHLTPDGQSNLQAQHAELATVLRQKRLQYDNLALESQIAQLYPERRGPAPPSRRDAKIEELAILQEKYAAFSERLRRTARNPGGDPAAQEVARKLAQTTAALQRLRQAPAEVAAAPDASKFVLDATDAEIRRLEQEAAALTKQMQDAMPEFQRFRTLLEERERLFASMAEMRDRLTNFEMLSRTQKEPVEIKVPAAVPTVPIGPRRALTIAAFVLLGLGLGGGLVCLLEHFDHSVTAPEQLTTGLTLPLLGVIPRMRRTARLHRGGHLWTPGAPESVEADAYRNVRASLLGLAGPRGPLVTLLVTSARAGEGKSTTALNLAATCARAGERTLLMDIDLRRPSLAEVFEDDAGAPPGLGLTDVLRGDLPWQRTVVATDIPNLDFLPTGETADVPVEVLGTLELRQLLEAVSRHYDRVILDGPAVLGMADCRMVGRVVDAALLVVRCGASDLLPPQRAKAMLAQSQVPLAGVVFNGLSEDLRSWSSYGSAYGLPAAPPPRRLEALAAAGGPTDGDRAGS